MDVKNNYQDAQEVLEVQEVGQETITCSLTEKTYDIESGKETENAKNENEGCFRKKGLTFWLLIAAAITVVLTIIIVVCCLTINSSPEQINDGSSAKGPGNAVDAIYTTHAHRFPETSFYTCCGDSDKKSKYLKAWNEKLSPHSIKCSDVIQGSAIIITESQNPKHLELVRKMISDSPSITVDGQVHSTKNAKYMEKHEVEEQKEKNKNDEDNAVSMNNLFGDGFDEDFDSESKEIHAEKVAAMLERLQKTNSEEQRQKQLDELNKKEKNTSKDEEVVLPESKNYLDNSYDSSSADLEARKLENYLTKLYDSSSANLATKELESEKIENDDENVNDGENTISKKIQQNATDGLLSYLKENDEKIQEINENLMKEKDAYDWLQNIINTNFSINEKDNELNEKLDMDNDNINYSYNKNKDDYSLENDADISAIEMDEANDDISIDENDDNYNIFYKVSEDWIKKNFTDEDDIAAELNEKETNTLKDEKVALPESKNNLDNLYDSSSSKVENDFDAIAYLEDVEETQPMTTEESHKSKEFEEYYNIKEYKVDITAKDKQKSAEKLKQSVSPGVICQNIQEEINAKKPAQITEELYKNYLENLKKKRDELYDQQSLILHN